MSGSIVTAATNCSSITDSKNITGQPLRLTKYKSETAITSGNSFPKKFSVFECHLS